MDKSERIERWQAMMDILRKEDVNWWLNSFVDALTGGDEGRAKVREKDKVPA